MTCFQIDVGVLKCRDGPGPATTGSAARNNPFATIHAVHASTLLLHCHGRFGVAFVSVVSVDAAECVRPFPKKKY